MYVNDIDIKILKMMKKKAIAALYRNCDSVSLVYQAQKRKNKIVFHLNGIFDLQVESKCEIRNDMYCILLP